MTKTDMAYIIALAAYLAAVISGAIRSYETMLIAATLLIAIAVMIIGFKSPNRGFYTLCFGEASVFLVFPSSLAAGVVAQLALIAAFLSSLGLFKDKAEIIAFLAYSLLVAGISIVIVSSEKAGYVFPALILLSGAGIVFLLLNEYRLGSRVTEDS